jgi:hypothetical protein
MMLNKKMHTEMAFLNNRGAGETKQRTVTVTMGSKINACSTISGVASPHPM